MVQPNLPACQLSALLPVCHLYVCLYVSSAECFPACLSLNPYVCLSICLSVRPLVHTSVLLSACPYIHYSCPCVCYILLSLCLTACLCARMSALSFNRYVCLLVYCVCLFYSSLGMFVCFSMCASVYMFICLSIYLSISASYMYV
jgi:hypothetical protein